MLGWEALLRTILSTLRRMCEDVQKPVVLQTKETLHPSVEMNKEQVTNSIYLTGSINVCGLYLPQRMNR